MIIIKNNAKRLVKISFLSLFLLAPFINVGATSLMDYNAVGYGFTYLKTNNTMASYSWLSYNTDYLQRDMSDFPSDVSHFGILLEDIGIRFRIDGGFKKDHNYIITFEWTNYDNEYDNSWSFYDQYIQVSKQWTCRTDSWSGTSQSESTCFVAGNYSEKQKLTNNSILITIHFTAKIDMYGMTIYWDNRNNANNAIYSQGWSIGPVSYEDITDESQAIIDNATQNTQNIINNQNTNTQNIINNQNQNTQAIIDSNKSCSFVDKKDIKQSDKKLNSSGGVENASNWGVTDYIKIQTATISAVQYTSSTTTYTCYYNYNKVLLSCTNNASLGTTPTIPAGAIYMRTTINSNNNLPTFTICQNGSQAVVDAITDNTPPDSSPIANATGWLPPGPVDSILNLPLTLMNSISNVISSGVCQPITIDLPHISNNPLVLPCMSTLWANIGLGTFFTWFGRILGGIILYKYLVRLYKWVDDTLTMRENNNFDDGSMG